MLSVCNHNVTLGELVGIMAEMFVNLCSLKIKFRGIGHGLWLVHLMQVAQLNTA